MSATFEVNARVTGADDARLQFVRIGQDDPLATPLLQELALEYASRYGRSPGEQYQELKSYPGHEFEPPGGVLLVALYDGVPVAGGAYRQYAEDTAELKRIWTAQSQRGRGFGKRVVAELERSARERGYSRVYLTTGWNQPEAVALYLAAGYTPLYDRSLPSKTVGSHPFEKSLE
ncbi:GNAT family N-acetyltransferase [Rhodococcus sp. 06-235-1A]|uniref:GNAT family N-acetyltransferase n=1 Tax=Rhodococcus sp. 06-235-1A TaxID=2022508 RepID=UPI000B9C4285|nr:GNAT family N-acetyltransferase [Rhodococcus sp. 06-235-1A]OZC97151.1 GNAT family N-acetyltransferase [Rhodococcus sp. 06-235-1A]OZC97221.1 GNAT family N-acetyltransferase [Rhodococcus sp. 06-235-1A]